MKTLKVRRSSRLVILDSQDRLLLFRYHDEHSPPFWATTGGELRADEDYRAAAERELQEETGFRAFIGPLVRERDEVYAVARSEPARWLEKNYLVRVEGPNVIDCSRWSEEEHATIRGSKWWDLPEMLEEHPTAFKPEWLPQLVRSILNAPASPGMD